jgi:hypothetical protein
MFVEQFGGKQAPRISPHRLTDNASGKLLIIFILSYLLVLPASFLRIPKTQQHFITGMTCKCIALLFFL